MPSRNFWAGDGSSGRSTAEWAAYLTKGINAPLIERHFEGLVSALGCMYVDGGSRSLPVSHAFLTGAVVNRGDDLVLFDTYIKLVTYVLPTCTCSRVKIVESSKARVFWVAGCGLYCES